MFIILMNQINFFSEFMSNFLFKKKRIMQKKKLKKIK
jgi:hypothetical protein